MPAMRHRMAFDRSLRSVDIDGRMRIEVSNISKAMVSPYLGAEIPDSELLGLDPNRVYYLLRDPEELAKAAHTFNLLPILIKHIPTSADDHPHEEVVGSTGTNAVFEAPYLKNSAVFWTALAIAGVNSKEQEQFSSSYHYRADMTPGVYDGVEFDGVMRDLIGNHVALVESGRAGPDVVAADSNPFYGVTEMKLSRTAIAAMAALGAVIRPKLAQDAKLPALAPLFADVSKATLKPAELAKKVRAVLAQDIEMTPEELGNVIESATDGVSDVAEDEETDEEKAAREKKEKDQAADALPDPSGKTPPKVVDKPAMDAAISTALAAQAATFTAVRVAENEVRPVVGEVAPQDTPEKVYKLALDALNYDCAGVDPKAYAAVFRALPKPGAAPVKTTSVKLAADAAAAVDEFTKMFPTAVAPARS